MQPFCNLRPRDLACNVMFQSHHEALILLDTRQQHAKTQPVAVFSSFFVHHLKNQGTHTVHLPFFCRLFQRYIQVRPVLRGPAETRVDLQHAADVHS